MPGEWWDVKHAEYHADRTRDSHSSLELFRRSIPLYHAVRTGLIVQEPTEDMVFGTAFHLMLLEPDRWDQEAAVAPQVDRRTKVGKAAWEEFQAQAEGKLVVSLDDYDRLRKMTTAALQNPWARRLLEEEGRTEAACQWEDPETGLPLKTLFDRILGSGVILDVKSAADPTPEVWPASAARYGYHRQSPFYQDAAWEVMALENADFVFLVVGKAPPYETVLYSPDFSTDDAGRQENRAILNELAERRRTGNWTSRSHGQIETFSLPRWRQPKL